MRTSTPKRSEHQQKKSHESINNNREPSTLSGMVFDQVLAENPIERKSAKRSYSSAAHEMDINGVGDLEPKAKHQKTEIKMPPGQFEHKSMGVETKPSTLTWNGNQLAHNTVAPLDEMNFNLNGVQHSNAPANSNMQQQMHNQQMFSMPLLDSFSEEQTILPSEPSAVKLENGEEYKQPIYNRQAHSMPPFGSFSGEQPPVQQAMLPTEPSAIKPVNLNEHKQPVYNGSAHSMPLLRSFTEEQPLVQQAMLAPESSASEQESKKKHKKHKKEKKKKSKEHREHKEHKKHKRDKKKSNSQQENDFPSDGNQAPIGSLVLEASSSAIPELDMSTSHPLKLKIPKCRIKYDIVGLANQSHANIVNSATSAVSNISPPIPKLRIKIPKQLLNAEEAVGKKVDRMDHNLGKAKEIPANQSNAQMVTVLFNSPTQLLLFMSYGLIIGMIVLLFCFYLGIVSNSPAKNAARASTDYIDVGLSISVPTATGTTNCYITRIQSITHLFKSLVTGFCISIHQWPFKATHFKTDTA